jgi:hypothetical protein
MDAMCCTPLLHELHFSILSLSPNKTNPQNLLLHLQNPSLYVVSVFSLTIVHHLITKLFLVGHHFPSHPFNIYYSLCNRLKYFMMMFNQTHCFKFAHMSITNKFIYIYPSWVDTSALCNWVNLKEFWNACSPFHYCNSHFQFQ